MSKLIAIDDGHGMNTPGKRTPTGIKSPETGKNFMHENEFNRAVKKYLDKHLRASGFKTLLVAKGDSDVPLATRVKRANDAKADFYISIHANANTGKWGTWGGTETYTWGSGQSLVIGRIIHKHLMKGTPLRDRGVKNGSHLYVIKNTKMPAVLVECAFMDNKEEAKLLISDSFRRECAKEIAMGICEAFGVKFKDGVGGSSSKPSSKPSDSPKPSTDKLYRVRKTWGDAKTQKGAYKDLNNAKALADTLKSQGYKVFDWNGKVVYDPNPKKETVDKWYRVRKSWSDAKSQIGAFKKLDGAKDLADLHAKEGYKVFDDSGKVVYEPKILKINEWYRVRLDWSKPNTQIGAFKELNHAKALADANANDGYKVFDDNGKVIYTPKKQESKPKEEPKPQPKPQEPKEPIDEHKGHNDIMGKSKISAEKMSAFVKSKNPNAQDIDRIAKAFVEVGEKYNIRGDVAFCQSIIETGWFKFDGGTAVTPDQHNYCGLGVTSKGVKGHAFDTVEDGVKAQIQHLYAYATKDALPKGEEIIDPRFKYVSRGVAPHWEDLNMRWAMNDKYGQHIISIYEQLEKFEYTPPVEEPKQDDKVDSPPVDDSSKDNIDEDEQFKFWTRVVDYLIDKLAKLFGIKKK